MKPSGLPSPSPGLLQVPLDPFSTELRKLRRWILSAFILGFVASLSLTTYVSVRLHTELVESIRQSVRLDLEKEYETKNFEEVFTEVLSRPKTVNAVCNKWWFGMNHQQQRKLSP